MEKAATAAAEAAAAKRKVVLNAKTTAQLDRFASEFAETSHRPALSAAQPPPGVVTAVRSWSSRRKRCRGGGAALRWPSTTAKHRVGRGDRTRLAAGGAQAHSRRRRVLVVRDGWRLVGGEGGDVGGDGGRGG